MRLPWIGFDNDDPRRRLDVWLDPIGTGQGTLDGKFSYQTTMLGSTSWSGSTIFSINYAPFNCDITWSVYPSSLSISPFNTSSVKNYMWCTINAGSYIGSGWIEAKIANKTVIRKNFTVTTGTLSSASKYSLSPNPTTGQFHINRNIQISSDESIKNIDLRLIISPLASAFVAKKISNYVVGETIDVSNLQKGMYIVTIYENNNIVETLKMIIN